MDVNTYKNITETINNYKGLPLNCMKMIVEKFPSVGKDTLQSIFYFEYQKKIRANRTKHQLDNNLYWDEYNKAVVDGDEPGIILRISKENDVCPCLIAKIILQKYYETHRENDDDIQVNVINYLRDTTLIKDMDLAYEVFLVIFSLYLCILCCLTTILVYTLRQCIQSGNRSDEIVSLSKIRAKWPYDYLINIPTSILISSLGQQYELELYRQIEKLKLSYKDENDLRKEGYDKTPDIKLELPVAVDGFVINWIESKAVFGEENIHQEYIAKQYSSYWNRFGSGLVIYWFGYLETVTKTSDDRFIIRDHLPTNIVEIDVEQLYVKTP